jgi:hypothetical protein
MISTEILDCERKVYGTLSQQWLLKGVQVSEEKNAAGRRDDVAAGQAERGQQGVRPACAQAGRSREEVRSNWAARKKPAGATQGSVCITGIRS